MSDTIYGYFEDILDFCINVIIAVVILIIGRFLIKKICRELKKWFEKSHMEESAAKFLVSAVNVVLYICLVLLLMGVIGIETTSFVAALTSAGLAVGLALQGSLSNFAGGVMILVTKPFLVGDYIVSDQGEGTVDRIDLFYTTLITFDNKKIMIPNSVLSDEAVTNVSAFAKRRVDITVSISYNSDIEKARETVFEILDNHPLILSEENNVVAVTELGESGVTLSVRAWTQTENYWDALSDLNERIKIAFDEAGIEIPFNQLDVRIKEEADHQSLPR